MIVSLPLSIYPGARGSSYLDLFCRGLTPLGHLVRASLRGKMSTFTVYGAVDS